MPPEQREWLRRIQVQSFQCLQRSKISPQEEGDLIFWLETAQEAGAAGEEVVPLREEGYSWEFVTERNLLSGPSDDQKGEAVPKASTRPTRDGSPVESPSSPH